MLNGHMWLHWVASLQNGSIKISERPSCIAGVDNGSRLRVRNEGNAGRKGGPPGDLFVFIQVRNNPKLRREGTTIHVDVDISYVDAILGTNVQVNFSCPSCQLRHHACLTVRVTSPGDANASVVRAH